MRSVSSVQCAPPATNACEERPLSLIENTLGTAWNRLDNMLARMAETADRICGVRPENDSKSPTCVRPAGSIPAIQDLSNEIHCKISALDEQLQRIERL